MSRKYVLENINYCDVVMTMMVTQVTSLRIIYSTVYSGADKRKHHSSASLAFVRGIHRWPVNSLHIGPVTRKMFPFDDVIMWPCYNGTLTVFQHVHQGLFMFSKKPWLLWLLCYWYLCITINPLRAKFFRGNINIYLYFVSFLHIDTTQVVEILPQIRQEPTYST